MNYTERLLGFQVQTLSKLRNDSSAKHQFSSFTPMLWLYFYNHIQTRRFLLHWKCKWIQLGARQLQWRRHWYTRHSHMEACCRKIRNLRKNSFFLLAHLIFHLLKYNSSVFASTEEELNQGWSTGNIVPAAEKPSGFGLPLYSSGLSLWLRSTSHGTDIFSGSCASLALEEGS